jgi:hypothetical protein
MTRSSPVARRSELYHSVNMPQFEHLKNNALSFARTNCIFGPREKGGLMIFQKTRVQCGLLICALLLQCPAFAQKKKTVRKVQEVNFAEMNLKGTFRNPDGAYLVQKRGIKFLPLYEVNKDMDARIRDSSFYVK